MLAWDYYIIKESKNRFKDWTKAGLEHLRKHCFPVTRTDSATRRNDTRSGFNETQCRGIKRHRK